MTPTTRKYPRTMREAFKDADYACAIERTEYKYESGVAVLVVVALFMGFAAILLQWL